jgi:hypothetical protein
MADAKRQVTIFLNGREVANQLKSVRAEKRKINAELNQMVIGSDEYNQKMKELRRADGILRSHRDQVRGVENSWKGMKLGLDKFLGVAAAAFTADAIVSYGKEIFKLGAEMEVLSRKANTVFGETLAGVTDMARENATAMGLTTSQYIDAAAAIADLLIPMGFARQEAADISTGLVDLSGALSEWTGGQIKAEEVTRILGKAMLGEREELKQLGIAISEADVKNRLAEKGLENLTGRMLEQAKATATLELVTEKSADAQAAFAQNTDTIVRRQAELAAKFEEIREKLATALLPVFERILSIVESVTDSVIGFADSLGVIGGASDRASQAVSSLQQEFNNEIETLARGNLGQENRKKLIDEINERYKAYLPNIIQEADGIDQIRAAQVEANKAFEQKITLLAAEEEFKEVQQQYLAARRQELQLQRQLTEAQSTFAASAEAARGAVGKFDFAQQAAADNAQALRSIENQIETNKRLQESLRNELDATRQAALDLGITFEEVSSPSEPTEEPINPIAPPPDKLKERLDRLQELLDQFQEDNRIRQLSEEEQAIEKVRQRYQKQIDEAIQLEREGAGRATEIRVELERQRDIEIQELRKKQLAEEFAATMQAINEHEAAKTDALIEKETERKQLLKQIDEAVFQGGDENLTEEERIKRMYEELILQTNQTYDALILQAEEYNAKLGEDEKALTIDLQAIYDQRSSALQAITKEEQDEINKITREGQEKRLKANADSFNKLGQLFGEFSELFANEATRNAEFYKATTLAQIAFDTASAISSMIAAAAATSITPIDLAIRITAGIAAITTNIAKASELLNSASIPQRKHGGFFNVIGQDDGRSYNAEYIGRQSTGMLPGRPVVLASEAGPEYFVSNSALQNPAVFNYVRAIDNIVNSRVPQFQEGGFTSQVDTQNSTDSTFTREDVVALRTIMGDLLSVIRGGIYAVIDDDTNVALRQRFNSLNDISGGVLDVTEEDV